MGLLGTEDVQRPTQRVPRPFKTIRVRFGQPIGVSTDTNHESKAARSRTVTYAVLHDIAQLCERPYVDSFSDIPAARRIG